MFGGAFSFEISMSYMYDIPHSIGIQLSLLKGRGFKHDILIHFLNSFINVIYVKVI